jgi:hypothetical protein
MRVFRDDNGGDLDGLGSWLDCLSVVAVIPLVMIYQKQPQETVFVAYEIRQE